MCSVDFRLAYICVFVSKPGIQWHRWCLVVFRIVYDSLTGFCPVRWFATKLLTSVSLNVVADSSGFDLRACHAYCVASSQNWWSWKQNPYVASSCWRINFSFLVLYLTIEALINLLILVFLWIFRISFICFIVNCFIDASLYIDYFCSDWLGKHSISFFVDRYTNVEHITPCV